MQKWEYIIYYPDKEEILFASGGKSDVFDIMKPIEDREIMQLSLFGSNGWELIATPVPRKYIFKRPSIEGISYPGDIGEEL